MTATDLAQRLNNPVVSASMGSVTLRNVRLGRACADFVVHPRTDGSVALEVLRVRGDLRISLVVDGRA